MMKRFFGCIALLIALIASISAQESQALLHYYPGYPSHVFGDNVNLRADSSASGKVIAQLKAGEKVAVLGRSVGTYTLNGRTEHWYRVSALRLQKEGYIWGGMLSCASIEGFAGAVFMINKVSIPDTDQMTMEVRAVMDDKILHVISVPDFPYYHSELGEFSLSASNLDNCGLSGYQSVLYFSSSLETGMCDVIGATTLLYILWDGKTMKPLPLIEGGIGRDEDFDSYGGESYIFPSLPEGKPDVILHRSIKGEIKEDGIEYTETTTVRRLVWDGKRFVLPGKK